MTVRMSEEEYQRFQGERAKDEARQLTAEELKGPAQKYEQAVAIDPGKSAGVACVKADGQVHAWSSTFWDLAGPFDERPPECYLDAARTCVILEAPYLSRPGMQAGTCAQAYNSGRVARGAELLEQHLSRLGYHVEEYDPARYQTSKWDRQLAEHMIGDWSGANNDDTRDALRLLFFYNFI